MIRLLVSILTILIPTLVHAACPPLSLLSRDLPDGKEGVRYDARIALVGGTSPVRMTVTEGFLPPGLSLSPDGVIGGIPRGEGEYRFVVTASDSCSPLPREARRQFSLRIGESVSPRVENHRKGKLRLISRQESVRIELPFGGRTVSLRHLFRANPPETAVLSSPGVSFLVDGSVVKSLSLPLDLLLINGEGEVGETVEIPPEVLVAARRGGREILVNRPFVGRGTTASSLVTVVVPAETPAGGGAQGKKTKGEKP